MARPIFDFELTDPDFAWLLEKYQERFPGSIIATGNPIIIFTELPGVQVQSVSEESEVQELFEEDMPLCKVSEKPS